MFEPSAPSHAATLFEKAQSDISMMQQIDQQIAGLLAQRRGVQNDLANVQSQINSEFNRLMRESDELPSRILAEISGSAPEAQPRPRIVEPAVAVASAKDED